MKNRSNNRCATCGERMSNRAYKHVEKAGRCTKPPSAEEFMGAS